ncbi:hypothetical protein KSP39_PZI020050 [Platanthera zijinensis]|uniref:Myb/SANT-like domain-containing protein n=1 Tax=Platanthera zijinensis TaxID=2320716 RepID=A0AAP0AYZ9_9ASPA
MLPNVCVLIILLIFHTLFISLLTYILPDIMEQSSGKVGGRTERFYMHWTSEMDIILSNALLEQHSLGHKTHNGWKSVAFTAAMTALKDICGIETSKEKVMARLKTWNKYYIEVSAMLATSGFGWD